MKIQEIIKTSTSIAAHKKIVLNIMFTQNIIQDRLNEVLKPSDISLEQFNVLRILRGQKGTPANMCDIQERMIAKTSNTTRLVDKLVLKDLVKREVCEHNRRKMEITITEKGLAVLALLDPKIEQSEKSFSDNLTEEELEYLNSTLEKYRQNNN